MMNNILPSMKSINLNNDWHIILYLMRFEWQKHNKIIQWAFCVWFLGLWAFLIFSNPIHILFFGIIFGMIIGAILGGNDVNEQSGEFSFCLPYKKEHIYFSRLLFGLLLMLFFTGIGSFSMYFQWPFTVWYIFIDTYSLIEQPSMESANAFWLAITMPLCVFSFSYLFAVVSPTEKLIRITFLNALFLGLAVFGFSMFLYYLTQINSIRLLYCREFQKLLNDSILEHAPAITNWSFSLITAITWYFGYRIYRSNEGIKTSEIRIFILHISLIVSIVVMSIGLFLLFLPNFDYIPIFNNRMN